MLAQHLNQRAPRGPRAGTGTLFPPPVLWLKCRAGRYAKLISSRDSRLGVGRIIKITVESCGLSCKASNSLGHRNCPLRFRLRLFGNRSLARERTFESHLGLLPVPGFNEKHAVIVINGINGVALL